MLSERITDLIPAAMMIAESVNNTFGRTVSPRNRKLTSGGSSGGESALISFGGSVLGVGTDIGESRDSLHTSDCHIEAVKMHSTFRKSAVSRDMSFQGISLAELLVCISTVHFYSYNVNAF
jgi:hypothetical protein